MAYKPWEQTFPLSLQLSYRQGIELSRIRVPESSQRGRILDTEGDIGRVERSSARKIFAENCSLRSDTLLTNDILPVIDVLNQLIHPELREHLLIVPSQQAGTAFSFRSQEKKTIGELVTSELFFIRE